MKNLNKLKAEIEKKIGRARDAEALEVLRVAYSGRKGKVTELLKKISKVKESERAVYGSAVNELKHFTESLIDGKKRALMEAAEDKIIQGETQDVTEPSRAEEIGHIHPVSIVMSELIEIFESLSFSVVEGPEIETDWYNFEALNIPPDHPARDTQDTFYVDRPLASTTRSDLVVSNDRLLLRTHTSPVQIHVMQKTKPPIRVIVPGRVYRRDDDPTHTQMFHQIEGLLVDESTNFAELKGTLIYALQRFFGPSVKVRFRAHHFPFTEPSAEIDISCVNCGGTGFARPGLATTLQGQSLQVCRVCKGTKWLEILGAGMVHPNVLKAVGIDSSKYRGFAFGIGIDRLAMLKFNVPDVRMFFDNDIRFLEQF